jgi:phosphatidylethanolamine/phosphatidyl-N-methylethanolamine N-methyltransferase
MAAEIGLFFGLWLRKPRELAAAVPSGPILADALGRRVALDRPGHVLELGAGTGSITRGLLRGGCPAHRLVVVEREPPLARFVRQTLPGVTVVEGNATSLGPLLVERRITALASAVSSLPIKWFSLQDQQAIVTQVFSLLGPEGCLLQVTNALSSPLPSARLGLDAEEVERIWLNFLPAQVWRYRLAERRPYVPLLGQQTCGLLNP